MRRLQVTCTGSQLHTRHQDTATSANRLSPKHVTYAKSVNFLKIFNFLHNGAAQRIAIAAYAQGIHLLSSPSAVGKVPGGAEYMTLYVYAWKASASKKAVQAALTGPARPFFRYVECGSSRGSAVPTLGHYTR